MAVTTLAATTHAQTYVDPFEYAHHSDYKTEVARTPDALPGRPLTLTKDHAQAYAGITPNLSKDVAFKGWTVPLGAGFGLLRLVEIGVDTEWQIKPWTTEYLVKDVRLYGRYLVVEGMLAAELALFAPTLGRGGMTAAELILPARLQNGPLELFGQAKLHYADGARTNAFDGGVATTGLFSVTDQFFAAIDVGFTYSTASNVFVGRKSNMILPVAIGAGMRISPDLFAKATFLLRDVANKNSTTDDFDGLDRRGLSIVVVQAFDLSPSETDRRTTAERRAETMTKQAADPTATKK